MGGACFDVLQEFAMITRTVRAEVLEDGGQWCVRHRDLEQIIAEWDLFGYCQ